MDLGDLLLVLLFLVFPLLQHLLDRRAAPRPPEGAEEEIRDLPMETGSRPDVLPGPEPAEGRPVSWEEWASGAAEAEALAGREVLDAEEAAELSARLERLPAEVVPEAVRVSAPVVSLEALHVHRPAKGPRAAQTPPVPAPPARSRPGAGLPALLRGQGQLRRAVVLSEVLGPPKGLR